MSTQIHCLSAKQASRIIEIVLKNNGIDCVKHPIHHNENGIHVYLKNIKDDVTYHIKYATSPFMTFGYVFRQYQGEIGETLDKEVIDSLKDSDVLFFAQPNKIYYCSVSKFKEFMLQRPNDKSQGKITYSVPMKILERFV